MRCPFCGASEDKVIETRVSKDGGEIRRRRECEGCDLNYVAHTPQARPIRYALSNSFGFGGTNGTLLMKRFEEGS